jgi:hypothetical protein
MQDGDDDVYVWALPTGGVLLEVRGPRARSVELRGGDVVEVAVREVAGGNVVETEVTLVRDGARTAMASGATTITVGGLYGPALAEGLVACATERAAFEVRLVRDSALSR